MSNSELNKTFITKTFDVIERNRQETEYYKNLKIPELESGNETQLYNISEEVKHSKYGQLTLAKITDVYCQNGYCYYEVENLCLLEDNEQKKIKKKSFTTLRTKNIIK